MSVLITAFCPFLELINKSPNNSVNNFFHLIDLKHFDIFILLGKLRNIRIHASDSNNYDFIFS